MASDESGDDNHAILQAFVAFLTEMDFGGEQQPADLAPVAAAPAEAAALAAAAAAPVTPSEPATEASGGDERGANRAPAALKKPRARGLTTQQKVAHMQQRVAEATAQLRQLSVQNEFMQERLRTLELVLRVRDMQLERLRSIQEGTVQGNPLALINSSIEELKTIGPAFLTQKVVTVTSMVAPRVARVLAVLDEHPSLVWGPVPGVEWLALRDGRAPLPEGVEQGRAEGWRALGPLPVEPHVMQHVYELFQLVNAVQHMSMFAFVVRPQILLAGSVHLHAIDPEQHVSFQALASLIKQASSRAAEAESGAGPAGPPHGASPVATMATWRSVIKHVRLSERQALQAAVLCDIMERPLAEIRHQRAELGQAFVDLQQPGGGSGAGGASSSGGGQRTASGGDATEPATMAASSQHPQRQASGDALARQDTSGSGSGGAAGHRSESQGSGGLPAVVWKDADTLQQEASILKRMQQNVAKELLLVLLVGETFFRFMLSPIQLGLLMVNAYPHMADELALIQAAAELYTRDGGRSSSSA